MERGLLIGREWSVVPLSVATPTTLSLGVEGSLECLWRLEAVLPDRQCVRRDQSVSKLPASPPHL